MKKKFTYKLDKFIDIGIYTKNDKIVTSPFVVFSLWIDMQQKGFFIFRNS
ncbi:hypothetical protein BLGI_2297 [Brevibacillus laterosporus GI-9]|nr:hypothetical protein BLGI_2297 [Brevibacillus laterosporus GI-9]